MEINRIPSKDSLVRCLDADRRVGTTDRDHDCVGGSVLRRCPTPLTVTVRVIIWFAAVVAGAVQVGSSAAALLNVPTAGTAVHAYVVTSSGDVARSERTSPPSTVWVPVWIPKFFDRQLM